MGSAVGYPVTADEAVKRLACHSGNVFDDARPSFVRMLKPYRGLRNEAYGDVIRCLEVLASELSTAEALPRSLIGDLWSICWYPRYWGLDPGGMLRKNNLISPDDQLLLRKWVDQITHTVTQLLEGATDDAFSAP